jgi:CheY-like chemotaxis protein
VPEQLQARHSFTVLLAEDEFLVRLALADHLRDCGWRVLEAGNSIEAQAILNAGEDVEVLFTDIQMPGGMDGIELAKWVHQNYPGVHLVLTSGVADVAVAATGLCEQASTFRKPYEHHAVARRLKTLVSSEQR